MRRSERPATWKAKHSKSSPPEPGASSQQQRRRKGCRAVETCRAAGRRIAFAGVFEDSARRLQVHIRPSSRSWRTRSGPKAAVAALGDLGRQ